jgi:hypothetical protein
MSVRRRVAASDAVGAELALLRCDVWSGNRMVEWIHCSDTSIERHHDTECGFGISQEQILGLLKQRNPVSDVRSGSKQFQNKYTVGQQGIQSLFYGLIKPRNNAAT